jgi:DNA polymerase I-like protein with 3'-5' exonuclease and polymerase domains
MSLPKVAKECVIPDKGKAIIQCDFSQIELRILAEITQDKNLLLAFDSGCDIHTATASLVYGKPTTEITEDERNSCKAINYGIPYGISAKGIKDNLNKLGISATLSQASSLRNRFLDVFPGIKDYQASVCTAKILTSLGGTKISTEKMKPTQALNWPIQTSCSEVLLASLDYLMINKDLSAKLINSIHDELWIETDVSLVNQEADMLFSCMQQGFQKYIKTVEFDGDIKKIERN